MLVWKCIILVILRPWSCTLEEKRWLRYVTCLSFFEITLVPVESYPHCYIIRSLESVGPELYNYLLDSFEIGFVKFSY